MSRLPRGRSDLYAPRVVRNSDKQAHAAFDALVERVNDFAERWRSARTFASIRRGLALAPWSEDRP